MACRARPYDGRVRSVAHVSCGLACAATAGCLDPTYIRLEIDTAAREDVTSTAITLTAPDALEGADAAITTADCDAGRVGSLVVTPSDQARAALRPRGRGDAAPP
jgi:hypothetical protein